MLSENELNNLIEKIKFNHLAPKVKQAHDFYLGLVKNGRLKEVVSKEDLLLKFERIFEVVLFDLENQYIQGGFFEEEFGTIGKLGATQHCHELWGR